MNVSKEFDALLSRLEPEIASAFEEAIQGIKDRKTLRQLSELIASGNIASVMEYLDIDQKYFTGMQDAYEEAFVAGGRLEMSYQASLRQATTPFNKRHLQSEEVLRSNGARMVTSVVEETKEAIRSHLTESLSKGKAPSSVSKELIGTRNRATGKRDGGIIGLTEEQRKWVFGGPNRKTGQYQPGAIDELGSPRTINKFLNRAARPRKYDSMLKNLRDKGQKPDADTTNKIVKGYEQDLLKYRANTISRTETHRALNQGRYQAMAQNAENAGVDPSEITVTWNAISGPRTRETHRSLNGDKVKYGQPFRSPSGASMRYPGDITLGAGGAETINCRCTATFRIGAG